MTPNELYKKFAQEFGFGEWPKSYAVDAETYGNVSQSVLDWLLEHEFPDTHKDYFSLPVAVGPNNGIMFKGVELLLKGRLVNGRQID